MSQRITEITEITALFSNLAWLLHSPTTTHQNPSLKISSFTQSLNPPNEGPSRVRVLDSALSLMCFSAPQVFDLVVECEIETIVAALLGLVGCEVWRFGEGEGEVLRVGSSIRLADCGEVVDAVLDVLGKLEEHGRPTRSLLYAVLRVAMSSSCYQSSFPYTAITYKESTHGTNAAISKFHPLPEEILFDSNRFPFRLLFWYLDPLTLKQDVIEILKEYVDRPFLSLKKELHERTTWCSVVICLVLAPMMFIETRILLHNWFLLTGLASVNDLKVELVSAVLDVLGQPMRWGISKDLALKLPFSHAFFRAKHQLLSKLASPISCEDFLDLVNHIRGLGSSAEEKPHPVPRGTSTKARMTHHKSTWALLIDFPQWFLFAAVLLFSHKNCQDNFPSKCVLCTDKTAQAQPLAGHHDAAARYLVQILSPVSGTYSDLLLNYLIKLSNSWKLVECGSDRKSSGSISSKKLRKFRIHGKEKDDIIGKDGCQEVRLWLKEFHDCLLRYLVETNDSCKPSTTHGQKLSPSFRIIPLGIFIGYSNINEEGCELLLHYASTGTILESTRTLNLDWRPAKHNLKGNDDDNFSKSSKDAKAGTLLMLNLFDTIEEITISLFSTEEIGLNFFGQLKTKAVGFLVKCVRKLLQVNINEGKSEILMLSDLYKRLIRWRHQGREDFEGCIALDETVSALSCKISSLEIIL
ncbi:hypothetical protein Syun_026339 [Stephania yunnanensis]|uniref:Uncharacterized protein n=1 Tax=Stephania yunnanensis TaxID=152371 RepID=A0AAP0F282_9MAGN